MALRQIDYEYFRHGAKRYRHLRFNIAEGIYQQFSDNQDNQYNILKNGFKKPKENKTQFTSEQVLAAIIHKNVHLVLRTQIFFFRIKLFFVFFLKAMNIFVC